MRAYELLLFELEELCDEAREVLENTGIKSSERTAHMGDWGVTYGEWEPKDTYKDRLEKEAQLIENARNMIALEDLVKRVLFNETKTDDERDRVSGLIRLGWDLGGVDIALYSPEYFSKQQSKKRKKRVSKPAIPRLAVRQAVKDKVKSFNELLSWLEHRIDECEDEFDVSKMSATHVTFSKHTKPVSLKRLENLLSEEKTAALEK